jgi:hypothetical protein
MDEPGIIGTAGWNGLAERSTRCSSASTLLADRGEDRGGRLTAERAEGPGQGSRLLGTGPADQVVARDRVIGLRCVSCRLTRRPARRRPRSAALRSSPPVASRSCRPAAEGRRASQ